VTLYHARTGAYRNNSNEAECSG